MSSLSGTDVQVAVVIPLDETGSDEVLVLREGSSIALPMGSKRQDEHLLDAAVRIVRDLAGFNSIPMRLLYLLEMRDGVILVGVLCGLPPGIDDNDELRGEFLSLTRTDLPLKQMALREILVEDLRSGFVRPVAHLLETSGMHGPEVQITW